jgi:hypothetical protein
MMANRLVITDDGNRILATVYQSGEATPLTVVELTVEHAVTLTAELISAVSSHLAKRAEYRREP